MLADHSGQYFLISVEMLSVLTEGSTSSVASSFAGITNKIEKVISSFIRLQVTEKSLFRTQLVLRY